MKDSVSGRNGGGSDDLGYHPAELLAHRLAFTIVTNANHAIDPHGSGNLADPFARPSSCFWTPYWALSEKHFVQEDHVRLGALYVLLCYELDQLAMGRTTCVLREEIHLLDLEIYRDGIGDHVHTSK